MDVFIAIDLGAGSGRVMAALLDDGAISLKQVHRFESPAIQREEGLFWDIGLIWSEIKTGLQKAARQYGTAIRSIGVDSWGVDYAWFDKNGNIMGEPYCYRDTRHTGIMERVSEDLGRPFIFERTGIQFMPINTIYQWCTDLRDRPEMIAGARCFLMIADIINYWLTGVMACERTNASTTQLYDARTRDWSTEMASRIGLSESVLPSLVAPGNVLGRLKPDVAAETGLHGVPVVAVGSHDTASAVAGIPASTERFAYLSCGTWALLGTERREPMITPEMLEHNFTNESGVENTFRLLKNITGLWIIQECRRLWQEEDNAELSFEELASLTEAARASAAFIDPDDPVFSVRGNHPEAIRAFCRDSGQAVPGTRGEILRVATESLALKVAVTLDQLEILVDERLDVMHVIGGGVNDSLLMQCLAHATERPVIAGPVEATALGNAIVQMIASGSVPSLAAGRARLIDSLETRTYLPSECWRDRRKRFRTLPP